MNKQDTKKKMIIPNNIYKGNCYELIKDIPDKSIDLIYTDIPYLIGDHGGGTSDMALRIKRNSELLEGKTQLEKWKDEAIRLKELMDNSKDKSEYEKWHSQRASILNKINLNEADITSGIDYSIFDQYMRVMKKMNLFIWCSKNQILDILNWFSKYGTFDILTWNKTNPTPATNNNWLPDIEYCLYFREKGVKLNDGYNLKSKWFISPKNKGDKDKFNHPTIKPLELVERHLQHTTLSGGVILDTFMGSGTTCVAAKNTGRQYIGFEINDQYFNIAKDRLNNIEQTGQTFLF